MKAKTKYTVTVESLKKIYELPTGWTAESYRNLLQRIDFDDIDQIEEAELKDYAVMALQDYDPDEAAEIVLAHLCEGKLKPGQIQNLAHDLMAEKQWEEYQDIRLHLDLYNATVLLKAAFPKKFPETNAIKCVLSIQPEFPIDKSFLSRLLAHGMNEHAVINRLFDEQVAGTSFPESEGIIWKYEVQPGEPMTVTIYSSNYWLHQMSNVSEYESFAYSDH
ncbi:hypothetical protein [Marinoscillum sp.]|uniref:hypothetical protein n=1 Tax=Marinoscillum sp. TaxID=2024838 RepID=UPI003BAD5EF3